MYSIKKSLVLMFVLLTLAGYSQKEIKTFTSQEDHKNMMDQLGITSVRPGPSGNESAPNHANYDESIANPFPNLPELLTLNNGKKVTSSDAWWNQRRPEIVEDMEREVYGRLPDNIPTVDWVEEIKEREFIGRTSVTARLLKGVVDNSSCPDIEVNIEMVVVTPNNVDGPVPLLMMFGGAALPSPAQPNRGDLTQLNEAFIAMMSKDPAVKAILDKYPAYNPIVRAPNPYPRRRGRQVGDPSTIEQLLAAGWGYARISPATIQADNGAGLTRGIIGLVNKGQPRKPDDWGSLRAWGWGASRALDYLETLPEVDATRVGIEGVSRYGKAALVTHAFDQRFYMVLIGSSGKGGTTLHRRNFGEAVESLTGSGEYHWMAGNYLKYGAETGELGKMNAGALPVDSHDLIAMSAPRLAFVSYGIPSEGDAKWLDHDGSYMAAIAAGKVYKLLGAKDLGVSNDYHTEKKPGVNEDMLEGHLAWRQHDGGHTDAPNIKHFIKWADKFIDSKESASSN